MSPCSATVQEPGPVPKTKTRKNITPRWADALIVGALLATVLVPYYKGWRLKVGPSMGNTLGLAYQVKLNVRPTTINQLVVVEEPEETRLKHWWWFFRRWVVKDTAKRVVEFRPTGVIVQGDNDDRSVDSRDWHSAIPWDRVRGVIVRRWPAPKTLREKITWLYPPRDQYWHPDGQIVATIGEGMLSVWNEPSRCMFSHQFVRRVSGVSYDCEWRRGVLVFMSSAKAHIYTVFDPVKGSHYSFDASVGLPREAVVGNRRVFVSANAEDVMALRARGVEPRVVIDGSIVRLVSPDPGNSLAEWSGQAEKVEYFNCFFHVERYGQ